MTHFFLRRLPTDELGWTKLLLNLSIISWIIWMLNTSLYISSIKDAYDTTTAQLEYLQDLSHLQPPNEGTERDVFHVYATSPRSSYLREGKN